MTPGPGATLAKGRYRLDQPLGTGGMASVWLAHDTRLDRLVAIKVVADAPAGDPQWATRFTREARAAASVEHPNVVTVYDHGLEDGRPYLVMAHVAGPNLAELLRDTGRPVAAPVLLAREIVDALGAVHRAGIVHRDIKAANVLVDHEGHAHLADFGIARIEGSSSLTQTGMIIGTLRYLAPEVVSGHPATVASDLFATGVLLREIAAVAPAAALDRLADALTLPDPADRPASAAEARRILDGGPPHPGGPAHPHDLPTAPTRRIPVRAPRHRSALRERPGPTAARQDRRRLRVIASAVALLAVVVVVAVIVLAGSTGAGPVQRARPAAPDAPLTEQLRSLQTLVDGVPR